MLSLFVMHSHKSLQLSAKCQKLFKMYATCSTEKKNFQSSLIQKQCVYLNEIRICTPLSHDCREHKCLRLVDKKVKVGRRWSTWW